MSQLVLVTGITGFIAQHVAAELLRSGYRVRGTLRSMARGEEVRAALTRAGADIGGLELIEADLIKDDNWAKAAADCDFAQHIASPFPIAQPRDRNALVPAARDGALRVIDACLHTKRIVVTSSMVAMMYRANRPQRFTVRESDWTDPKWGPLSAYIVSKTVAEQAVWQDADARNARHQIVTINPGFVLGPALSPDANTSLDVLLMMLKGAYPAMPAVSFPIVDVRDLAKLQVAAMTTESVGGRRLIAAGETLSMQDMALTLKQHFPAYAKKIPTGSLPGAMVRTLALFDRNVRTILADLGVVPIADAKYVTDLTGVTFRPAHESVIAAGQSLVDFKLA